MNNYSNYSISFFTLKTLNVHLTTFLLIYYYLKSRKSLCKTFLLNE